MSSLVISKETIHKPVPIPTEQQLAQIGQAGPSSQMYRLPPAQTLALEVRLRQVQFDALQAVAELAQSQEADARTARLQTIQTERTNIEGRIEDGRAALESLEAQFHERIHPLVCAIDPLALRDANREYFGDEAQRYADLERQIGILERELGIMAGDPSELEE